MSFSCFSLKVGNKTTMMTYRDESCGPDSGDVTTWLYDGASGVMTNKVYADGKGPRYDYDANGRLTKRTWARGIDTFYAYDGWGNLTNTTYSDDTPTVAIKYDALGRQIEAHDAAGVTTFAYDAFGANTNETVVGVAGTNVLERFNDGFGRDAGYALNGVRQSTLGYDLATGRIASMLAAGSTNSFEWAYLPGTDLKSSLLYPNDLTASWSYDNRGNLLQVRNAFPTNVISQYDYTYDAAGRRVRIGKSGSAFAFGDVVSYGYNARSELTNAVAVADANYRYSFQYDPIGNRETSSERGTNTTYAANELNQYTAVDDFVQQFDDDGNQTLVKTATGIWQVAYNGENRPVLWTCGPTNIVMSYDRMGRRVAKNDQRFVYDGYLQIYNYHTTTTTPDYNYFFWDPSEPIATRPLVWNHGTSAVYYTHDGNKNVSDIIDSYSAIVAHYEYAAFGATIAQSGDSAVENPWRFSSEYADDELGCDYYNYREYEPLSGRWMNRDPLEERNSYAFVENFPETNDVLGLIDAEELFSSYFNPSAVGSFQKDIIRAPLGSGFFVLSALVSIEMFSCCDSVTHKVQTWIEGDAGFEAFYEMGFDSSRIYPGNRNIHKYRKESGYAGKKKKNQMVPHPCNPGEMINIANYNKYASDCRKKVRKPRSSLNPGGTLRLCPKNDGLYFKAGIFARGTIGAGVGVEVDGRIDLVALLHRKESFLDSLSGSAHMTLGIVGATLDIGGWGWASWQKRVE